MIAIIGSSHDDILYFDSIISNKRKETILGQYNASIGTIFNQEVIILGGLTSSILSSAVMSKLLSMYYISLVFIVGKCISITKGLKCGDIVISSRVINADVDMLGSKNVIVGQIPGLPRDFTCQRDVITYLTEGLSKRTFAKSEIATFLSSDNQLDQFKNQHEIFGINEKMVMDNNSGGIAVACHLYNVPFISIKVIEKEAKIENNISQYIKVLEQYINVGKGVVSTIGDIGRNDILVLRGNKYE